MSDENLRYFLATSGVKLPLKLVNQIESTALTNRNTYIRAWYDGVERLFYGDIELSHVYDYDADGRLRRAEILMLDEDPTVLHFDENGQLAPV